MKKTMPVSGGGAVVQVMLVLWDRNRAEYDMFNRRDDWTKFLRKIRHEAT